MKFYSVYKKSDAVLRPMCMPHGDIRVKKVFLFINKCIREYLRLICI